MGKPRGGWVWLVALGLALTSSALAVPSKYVRQKAVTAADKVLAKGEAALGRYAQLKADNRLDELAEGDEPRARKIARSLQVAWDDGYDAYCEALREGWPPDDAELTKARGALEAARAKFEAAGMWVCVKFGEPPIPGTYRNRLEVIRDQVCTAGVLLRNKQVDKATALFDDADRRLKAIVRDAERAADDGDKTVIAPGHPALKRTLDEVARLKGLGAGALADSAKLRAGVDADVEALLAAREKHAPLLQALEDSGSLRGSEEQRQEAYAKLLAAATTFDKEQRAPLEQLLKDFGGKYGTKLQPIQDKLFELKGANPNYRFTPGTAYEQLVGGLAKAAQGRKESAVRLAREATEVLDGIDKYSEELRVSLYDRERPKLAMALAFDPDNAAVKARLAGLDAEKAAKAAQIEKLIDARTFPGHAKNFQGPGSPAALAASALAWLKANPDPKDPADAVVVRVAGDWEVGEKDVLGRALNYQLPVLVAFVRRADKAAGRDLAVVFELSMITRELKKAPPWKIVGTLGSWRMRASKLPAAN